MVNRYVEVIPFSNYFIIEVFDHFESNGAAICELELYNKSNEKINYTVMNVCDSNNGNGIPTYWVQRPNIWDKPNLYDGEIIYTSNSVGAENCTLFLYGSSANSEKWARFLVYS
ncbi:MAG: hypothetical protein LBQ24_07500 [Candidatus Peribacteria bacterium]|jgi:hypothetical protein|nr:hypothetical protein [Candidatus Peribacteria bacterium]